jgi:acetyl esterase
MAGVHPQVAMLLERMARSPLPPYATVPPFVARRLYRDTRAAVSPAAPEVGEARLLLAQGPGGPIALRAYRPSGSRTEEVLPALVYFHGGGWTIGDLDTHDVVCRQLANGARCAVFSVDYRMGPESPFPAAVDDCLAATQWVAAEAGALRVDAARIAVGGDSAGGNLATVVALLARDRGAPRLCFQLLVYPATDQRMGFPGLPPALVITAGFDPLVDEGKAYAERLAREGVQVAQREYPDMVHGFLLMGGVLDTANAAVGECCGALRAAFDGAKR